MDDLIWLTPEFDTQMSLYVPKYRRYIRGSFEEALIQNKYIDDNASYFDLNHYCVYLGGDYPLVQHRNEQASVHKKILVLKDSFSLPYQCFLSTVFSEVDVIDPRYYTEHTVAEYVEATNPDLVMLAINPSVFGWKRYFNYPLPVEHSAEGTILYQDDVALLASNSNYAYKTLDATIKPGTLYNVTINDIQITEGSTDGVFLALYDAKTKKFYDSTVLDLAYCRSVGEYAWSFYSPAGKDVDVKLLVYAGKHGQTNGISAIYQQLVLTEYSNQ